MSRVSTPDKPRREAVKDAATESTDGRIGGLVSAKIKDRQLERLAIVYVRQSSHHQVLEHRESKARQYLLADYAVRLGWPRERVLIIDEDQGVSANGASDRSGFQRLLAEVTMDHVGMVLGLEMSRLARSDKEWHHLLEVCGIFDTVLADQDGVYDAADPNDRLLLGLKGTMSTLELHTMRNRLEKGRLFKAQRGELFLSVPSGYVKLPSGGIALDPDEQVQDVVRLIFEKFAELQSARAVFAYLLRHGIRLGIRPHYGANRGQVEWRRPSLGILYGMLHHPFYAGAYAYGRCPVDPKRKHMGVPRARRRSIPMDQWRVLKRDCVPAYITWEQYARNREQLRKNGSGWEKPGTPRQGEALLGGLLVCGRCGSRMSVFYTCVHRSRYECLHEPRQGLPRTCRGIRASSVDALITQQILAALDPAALELSLRAAEDVQRERERQVCHWRQQLERARYDCHQAERCYRAVDPENRLVARTLERKWEQALHHERQLEEDHQRFLQKSPTTLSPDEKARIQTLAADIPALWKSPATTAQDRKTIVRFLVDRVVLNIQEDTEYADLTIHWVGGFFSEHQIQRPVRRYNQLRDFDQLVKRIRELHGTGRTAGEIADQLGKDGFHPPRQSSTFSKAVIRQLMSRLKLGSERRDSVVLQADEWWASNLAKRLRMPEATLRRWMRSGWVRFRRTAVHAFCILWADRDELQRLGRLRALSKTRNKGPFPSDLVTPKTGRPCKP